MDSNMLKEINYLTRLIEQHKRKSSHKLQCVKKIHPNPDTHLVKPEKCTNFLHKSHQNVTAGGQLQNSTYVNTCPAVANVHVNPNFKPQNPAIHINPKIRAKPLIHINPKMMKEINNQSERSNANAESILANAKENPIKSNIKNSVYVNPKLIKKLTSVPESKPADSKQILVQESPRTVCSRLKFVKNVATTKATPKKLNNSNVVILSRRKLVRVIQGSKRTTAFSPAGTNKIKRLLQTPFKKTKVTPQKTVKVTSVLNNTRQSVSKENGSISSHIIKPKFNKYRIDRTVSQATKVKKREVTASKRTVNKTMELITIGGIVYKSSKNHLVRRSYSPKKKRPVTVKTDKFIIATNGKKLRRVKTTKEKVLEKVKDSHITPSKLPSNGVQKINHKNLISHKVKQRSIQILRNKMRKNNQPCLLFQRFGYCANYENGICPKLHDKKQVSLCKKFLQGNCLLSNCQLSHDVGPEKMPTCKYFLEGCCTRDTCPYLHVKVSSTTPICIEFLQGYCAKGHKCKRRHECLCPEFEKSGKCSKGKYCPYPHKSKLCISKHNKYLKRKHAVHRNDDASNSESTTTINHENRLRYYQQTDEMTDNINEKRESIMKKIKMMKSVQLALQSQTKALTEQNLENYQINSSETTQSESELKITVENKTFRRPPIGSLPAYIPIN